jgi:hypothetical protein
MPSELNVNKISPASGTEVSLGDSGDTITIPSGVTLAGDGSNLTGVAPTKATIEALGIELPAANLTGTVADARISTLTASKLSGTIDGARLPDPLPAIDGSNLTGVSGGKVLQMVSAPQTTFTSGNSHNAWVNIPTFTLSITPTASTSSILLILHCITMFSNTAGDAGMSIRFKQTIGSTVTYPEGVSSGTNGNYHTLFYSTIAQAGYNYGNASFHGVASPATTSAVTYNLQYGTYNTEAASIGGSWDKGRITLIEIGA